MWTKLLKNEHLECSVAPEHVYSYVAFIVSGEQKINSRISYFQITNADLWKEGGQDWLRKHQLLFRSRHAQAETSFKQKKDCTRRPSLRITGYRIERRTFTKTPGEAAKSFRQAMEIEV